MAHRRRGVRRLSPVVGLVVLITAVWVPAPVRGASGHQGVVTLTLDEPRFWDSGVFVDGTERFYPGGVVPRSEWRWTLQVPPGGWRLRVGMTHPDPDDSFQIRLIDSDGIVRANGFSDWGQTEVVVWDRGAGDSALQPQPGDWTIRVVPTEVTDSGFQLRALLQKEPRPPAPHREYLPNLRAEPPFDLGFRVEVPLRHSSIDEEVERPVAHSCLPDEMAEDGVTRCLRLAFAYHNTGRGPYELRLEPRQGAPLIADAYQRVYREDDTPWDFTDNDRSGSYRDLWAGTAKFHETHGHWHYDNIVSASLWRVTPDGLQQVGDAAKRGACAHDLLFVDFHRFYQDEKGRHDSARDGNDRCSSFLPHENAPGVNELAIALSSGWADVYGIDNPDNYVSFIGAGDGEYVLRLEVDLGNLIEETRENDNVAYTHFTVVGDEVALLERGRGTGPADPDKNVLSLLSLGA